MTYTRRHEGGRRYYHIPELGHEVPSVTTVIGILEKYALYGWYAKMAAEYIKNELIDQVDDIRLVDTDLIVKEAKKYPERIKNEAGDIGTRTHRLIERYLSRQSMDRPIDADIEGPFNAFVEWWSAHTGTLIESEHTVWSKRGYAGTLDIVAKLRFDGWARRVYVVDLKTSNGFWSPEMPMQIAAYRHAYEERTGTKVGGMGVLRLDKKTGRPHWKEYRDYRGHRTAFLRVLDAFNALQALKKRRPTRGE